eukprot:m51a1_g5538 putative silent information regulator family protein (781) ;mRNA; f:466251-469148
MDGFSITPKRDCPHVCYLAGLAVPPLRYPNECAECGDAGENWLCLQCATVHCSRYVHGHASRHHAQTGHDVAVSWADCSAWCYRCEDYVDHPLLGPFVAAVQNVKFGQHSPAASGTEASEAPSASAPPAHEEERGRAREGAQVIEGQSKCELTVEGAQPSESLELASCSDCRVRVEGEGLGSLVLRGCTGCRVRVGTARGPSEVAVDSCSDVDVDCAQPAGNVHVTASELVALGVPAGWETLHTTGCAKVSLRLPGGGEYRVLSTPEHIITQIVKGQVVSEFSERKKRPRQTAGGEGDEAVPVVPHAGRRLGHETEEEVQEFRDTAEDFAAKMQRVAVLVRRCSGSVVVYTGAGVSTSAQIPDYRGPRGVWTLRDRGQSVRVTTTFEAARPTPAHMAIAELVRQGVVSFVATTNVDGLHMRSGLGPERLAELHGNAFLETCRACEARYLRDYDVTRVVGPHKDEGDVHSTGRDCDKCGRPLYDSIVHFGEMLPQGEADKAVAHSKCKLSLVLGTSMRVTPACDMPLEARRMVICNLQRTPCDDRADLQRAVMSDNRLRAPDNVTLSSYRFKRANSIFADFVPQLKIAGPLIEYVGSFFERRPCTPCELPPYIPFEHENLQWPATVVRDMKPMRCGVFKHRLLVTLPNNGFMYPHTSELAVYPTPVPPVDPFWVPPEAETSELPAPPMGFAHLTHDAAASLYSPILCYAKDRFGSSSLPGNRVKYQAFFNTRASEMAIAVEYKEYIFEVAFCYMRPIEPMPYSDIWGEDTDEGPRELRVAL